MRFTGVSFVKCAQNCWSIANLPANVSQVADAEKVIDFIWSHIVFVVDEVLVYVLSNITTTKFIYRVES